MFEIESADKVRLRDCETTSETVLKASGKVRKLDAARCYGGKDFVAPANEKITRLKRFTSYCIDHISQIVVGLLVAAIAAWLKLS
jgi:hypothetical protein